jgi:sec-independent protein translocase protein TatC
VWRNLTSPRRGIAFSLKRIKEFFTEEPEDTPLVDVVSKSVSDFEGILMHLDAFRKHLLRSLVAFGVTTVLAFIYTPRFIDLLAEPIGGIESLTAIQVTEPISVFFRVAMMTGLGLALPYIAFELWLFVAPGLSARSRIMGLLALPAVAVFFLSGVLFSYFILLPTALPFLMGFMGMNMQVTPTSYVNFVTGLLFWIGISFEFPLVIYVLARIGIVKPQMLQEHWRVAVVVIAILAAAITPTVDPITMSVVMVPLIVLYVFSIGLAHIAQRKLRGNSQE